MLPRCLDVMSKFTTSTVTFWPNRNVHCNILSMWHYDFLSFFLPNQNVQVFFVRPRVFGLIVTCYIHLFYLECDIWSSVTFCLMLCNSFNVDVLLHVLFTICFVTLCQFEPDVIRSVTFCQVVTFDLFSEIAVYTITHRTFCLLKKATYLHKLDFSIFIF